MGYTNEEVSAAVEKIVRSGLRYDYDVLGVRQTGTSFGDLQDAASGMFISRDGAPFYVALLARDRLLEFSASLQELVGELDGYATALSRTLSPVTRTRPLTNARVALDALASATAQRTGSYQNIENIPAFLRFERNTDTFLEKEGQKLNYKGDVIETPEQARTLVRPALVNLRENWDELLRKTELLMNSISSYTALNLPARLSQAIMENASSVLRDRVEELDAMDPVDRLTVLRDVVLDVLAARSTVRGFGSLEPPTTFVLLSGTGYLFADATHPATPAELIADLDGGYVITEDQAFLDFLVDGTHSIQLFGCPGSFQARLDFVGQWNREVYSGKDSFRIRIEPAAGSALASYSYDINLSASVFSPIGFATAVNGALGAGTANVEAAIDFEQPLSTQSCLLHQTSPTTTEFTAPVGVVWTDLGVTTNDLIYIDDLSSPYHGSYYVVTALLNNVLYGYPTVVLSTGDATVRASVGRTPFPIIRLVKTTFIEGRYDLILEDIDEGTLISIGMASGSRARAARTSAQNIRDALNVAGVTYVGGAARLEGDVVLEPDYRIGTTALRTHPEDPTALSMYLYRGQAEVTAKLGNSATLQLLDEIEEDLSGAWKACIIRVSTQSGDIDNHAAVVFTAPDVISGAFQSAVDAALGDVLTVEVGWDYESLYGRHRYDVTIDVQGDFQQSTKYQVYEESISATTGDPLPLEVLVNPNVQNNVALGNQPQFLTGTVGRYRAVFRSLSTLTDSKVECLASSTAPALSQFFSGSAVAYGTTQWIRLPSVPKRLEPGDQLEIHLTSPTVPDLVRTIESIEEENLLMKVTEAISLDVASSINFSNDSPVPFARIRKQVKQNFDDMSLLLKEWLDLPVNNALLTFRNLDASLNSLLINKNPTPSQIGTFRSRLQLLTDALEALDGSLSTYDAEVVDEVDTLLKSFRAKGADRAVDVLLEGDFPTFFGLDAVTSSYSGNVQRSIQQVQRDDLPVRKDNRQGFDSDYNDTHIGSFDDVDFEKVAEDADSLENVVIPEINDVLAGLPTP